MIGGLVTNVRVGVSNTSLLLRLTVVSELNCDRVDYPRNRLLLKLKEMDSSILFNNL